MPIWNQNGVYDGVRPNVIFPVTSGLVLFLDAAVSTSYPGTGTTWTDLSGLNNTGTLVNGPTFSSVSGGAIVFDGVDDYVSITETSGMTPNVLTLECVFEVLSDTNSNSGGAPTTDQFICLRQNSRTSAFEGYTVAYNETNRRILIVTTPAGGGQSILNSTNNSIPLNTKIHATILYDTTQQSIYINGSLNAGPAAKSSGIDYNSTHTLKIGRAVAVGSAYEGPFNGRIYAFRIYNRILTAAEITQNFNAFRVRYGI